MWSGVMPAKNFINQTYLDEIVKIVDYLASFGIYKLIDLHQDMLSSNFESPEHQDIRTSLSPEHQDNL